MKATVIVSLKKSINDPNGQALKKSLQQLGFSEFTDIKVAKLIEIDVKSNSISKVRKIVTAACKKLLANPVIEDYEFEIEEPVKKGRKTNGEKN